MTAQFIGVGVGPGDPELVTLKAARLIQNADVISYICNEQGQSQAKTIATLALAPVDKIQQEIAVTMPMSNDRTNANIAYDQAAIDIQIAIKQGKQVVFLCEGDPLFFGSFAYLLERLQKANVGCEIVPGISSVHAASSALQMPLTVLKESFAVMSGHHSHDQLVLALSSHDSVVVMKAGRSREKIIHAIRTAGRLQDAKYLEYIGRDKEMIECDLEQLQGEAGPYFSLFVVNRSERHTLV